MEAILTASKEPGFPAQIALVLSDNPQAKGLKTAAQANLASAVIPRSEYASRNDHETAIKAAIDAFDVDLVCLAGYRRILSGDFTRHYQNQLVNIHPSLLPKLKGLDTHQRAIDAGETEHGCTVHHVNAEVDGGKIVAQASVRVFADDTAEDLAARVLIEEHRLYPEVIRMLCT